MATNVSIIEIMRAFYRWDPMDVKQLFAKEFEELLTNKDKQIDCLNRQLVLYESIIGPNGVKKMTEMSVKMELLAKENQLIRSSNSKLFIDGEAIMGRLSTKVNKLKEELEKTKEELNSSRKKVEELKKSCRHLNSVTDCGESSAFGQTVDPNDENENLLVNDMNSADNELSDRQKAMYAQNRQKSLRLTKTLVSKIFSLKTENSKLKQQIKGKTDLIADIHQNNNKTADITEEPFLNDLLQQNAANNHFENFYRKLQYFFVDKSTQTID